MYAILKRTFDIIAALVAIVFFLIPWLVIAIIIKVQSPGPVLYKPERVGKDGNLFILYKFRSMRVDSGAIHATTLRNDSRIFPFGAFLRKTKLDETPQLVNILKSEMSVIGPRPEDKVNAERLYIGKYKEILSVKPGLSSPASLYDYTHGELYENEDDYIREFEPRKLDVELYYVNHMCISYDIEIIKRTVITIALMIVGKKSFEEPNEVRLCKRR